MPLPPYLSYSQLSLYLDCPLKYKFRYLDGIRTEGVSSAMAFGIAIHKALAHFYTEAMEAKPFSLDGFLKVFEIVWQDACEEQLIIYKDGESSDSLLEYGKVMLRLFAREIMPMKVIGVEMPFEFNLRNPETGEEFPIPIKGIIDLVEEDSEGTLWIVDHKTAARSFSQTQIDADLQMMIYAAAVTQMDPIKGRDIRLRLDVLVKTKTPKFVQYRLYKDDKDRRKLYQIVEEMYKAIEARAFYPRYSSHYSHCQYEDYCREW